MIIQICNSFANSTIWLSRMFWEHGSLCGLSNMQPSSWPTENSGLRPHHLEGKLSTSPTWYTWTVIAYFFLAVIRSSKPSQIGDLWEFKSRLPRKNQARFLKCSMAVGIKLNASHHILTSVYCWINQSLGNMVVRSSRKYHTGKQTVTAWGVGITSSGSRNI